MLPKIVKCQHAGCPVEFEAVERGCRYKYCAGHRGKVWSSKRYNSVLSVKERSKNRQAARRYALRKKTVEPCIDCTSRPRHNKSRRCLTCIKARDKERTAQWYAANPLARMNIRAKLYGLSVDDYIGLLESQGGRCAICRTDFPGRRGVWPIDHDGDCCPIDYCNSNSPACGKCVRGLLCFTCNSGIAHLKHDPAVLIAAAEYLKSYQERRKKNASY